MKDCCQGNCCCGANGAPKFKTIKLKVEKKNGLVEDWDDNKVIAAINKAAARADVKVDEADAFLIVLDVIAAATRIFSMDVPDERVTTTALHNMVIKSLKEKYPKVAQSYQEYRDYKNTYAKEFEKIKSLADDVLLLGDKENANFDSSLISTKGSLIKGYLTKSLYTQFFLSPEERANIKRGDYYIHDLRDMMLNSINCCLFDMGNVLKGGFTMSNVQYSEPNSVLSALQVIGDITLVATAQQFGGFTIPEIDKVLLPYCRKTYYNTYNKMYIDHHMSEEEVKDFALDTVQRELEQGFQSLELKLNTVPCSRGDFAFTTLTFGHMPEDIISVPLDKELFSMIGSTILYTREKGHGGKQVVFPKLVFLYDENQVRYIPEVSKLFTAALHCSSKCMYPDYLSLTGDIENNVVAQVYKDSGEQAITSPMGKL